MVPVSGGLERAALPFAVVWVCCLEGPLVSFSLGWGQLPKLGRSSHASLLGNFGKTY